MEEETEQGQPQGRAYQKGPAEGTGLSSAGWIVGWLSKHRDLTETVQPGKRVHADRFRAAKPGRKGQGHMPTKHTRV